MDPDDQRDPARGKRIREMRRACGYTSMRALAARVGVHVRTVENWESGKPIDGPNLARLALLLETTTDFLWTGRDGTDPDSGDPEMLARRVAALEGQLARERDLLRFVRSNQDRISALERTAEDSLKRVETDLSALRELMEGTALVVKELKSQQSAEAAHSQPAEAERLAREKRASGGRRQSDPPLPPGQ